jgi:hypothetical protein
VQQDSGTRYVILSIRLASELLEYKDEATAEELSLEPGNNYRKLQQQMGDITGPACRVRKKYRQKETLYKLCAQRSGRCSSSSPLYHISYLNFQRDWVALDAFS